MPKKIFRVEDIGDVQVHKLSSARHLRLRVNPDGTVRVTIPRWAPYKSGYIFAQSKKAWIQQQIPAKTLLTHDTYVGKKHRVVVRYGNQADKLKVGVADEQIFAILPLGTDVSADSTQEQLTQAAEKALRIEAKEYLPRRLQELAMSHNFTYRRVAIKKMKSRWGSCTSQKNISLNIYLMQLDDALIDYVLLHELLHTRIQAHGKVFWTALEDFVPDLANVRKRMRYVEPRLFPR